MNVSSKYLVFFVTSSGIICSFFLKDQMISNKPFARNVKDAMKGKISEDLKKFIVQKNNNSVLFQTF